MSIALEGCVKIARADEFTYHSIKSGILNMDSVNKK